MKHLTNLLINVCIYFEFLTGLHKSDKGCGASRQTTPFGLLIIKDKSSLIKYSRS